MQKHAGIILLILLLGIINSSCLKDSQEELFPELGICDTLNISYTADILPIMENICYACHSSESDNSGLLLDNYESLNQLATTGRLLGALQHKDGYTPMPLNSSKLDDCSLLKFEAWVNQGAKDN